MKKERKQIPRKIKRIAREDQYRCEFVCFCRSVDPLEMRVKKLSPNTLGAVEIATEDALVSASPGSVGLGNSPTINNRNPGYIPPSRRTRSSYGPPYPLGGGPT